MRSLRQRRKTRGPEISMLNLIDIIFTMLIFFMVATTFNNYSQLGINVPDSDMKKTEVKEQKVEILLNKNMEYFLKTDSGIKKIDINNLNAELSFLNNIKDKNITLTADKELEYGLIIELMGKLKNTGIRDINLNIQSTGV
jgi:biopolymer transport protein ExbD